MVFAAVLISAGAEWRVVRQFYPDARPFSTPYGEGFEIELAGRPAVFLHGGWGKIAAAASTQYVLSRWAPQVLVNLGTCGGFAGRIARGETLLVERALVYDINEQRGDPQAASDHYAFEMDLAWLREPYPQAVRRSLLVSADRDICAEDIPMLVERYSACAADWESGAIAWVAARSRIPCLILRGVSDLVGAQGGEAYGAMEIFQQGARQVMEPMLRALPAWLDCMDFSEPACPDGRALPR